MIPAEIRLAPPDVESGSGSASRWCCHAEVILLVGVGIYMFAPRDADLARAMAGRGGAESIEVGMLDEDAAREIMAELDRQDAEHKAEEAKKEENSLKAPGQVVDLPTPREEKRPDDARFVSEHDSSVEHETKKYGRFEDNARQGNQNGSASVSRPAQPSADAALARRIGQLRLHEAHRLVAEIASQAAAEARHARAQRHLEATLVGLDEVERVALVGFDHAAVADHFAVVAGGAQQGARGQADEGIAAETLAAHHRLEKKAQRLAARQLQIKRQRRLQIGEGFADQWNAVVALGGQALEFKFCDHVGALRGPGPLSCDSLCESRRGSRANKLSGRRVREASGELSRQPAAVINRVGDPGDARARLPGRATLWFVCET